LEFKYLRQSLIPGLLKNLSENRKNYEKINLFEIGSIFYKSEEGTKEERVLSLISSSEDFYQLKGKIDLFLEKIFLSSVSYHQKGKKELFHDKKTGEIFIGKEKVGFLGEITEEIKKGMKIKENILIAEINLEKIIEMYKEIKDYEPILKFPPSVRDLAVLVPEKTLYKDVFEKIKREGGTLLKEISLFDFYKGKEVPEGMKSFAFRLIFRAKNKTLSSEEVVVVFEKIINALEEVSEYKVRK
jgi:phenylalanyl-tRNA synthetase beta chain